jgi:hypothetical protein
LKLPLFDPLVGDTLSQLWLSVIVQLTFDVTETGVLPDAAPTVREVGETVRVVLVVPPTVTLELPLL